MGVDDRSLNPGAVGAGGPPAALVAALRASGLSGLEWHDRVTSTNTVALSAAARGVPEVHAVVADEQSAGRGRLDRVWKAPAGTSLLLSLVLRPPGGAATSTLPLLCGLALADALAPFAGGQSVALKWPNDVLVGDGKVAGILLEAGSGAVVAGMGVNVDWRGVDRPPDLAGATSLAEAAGGDVDRWRVLAAVVGVFARRYRAWADGTGFIAEYRERCGTIGRQVRVSRVGAEPAEGTARDVDADGALVVDLADGGTATLHAGDVEHVR